MKTQIKIWDDEAQDYVDLDVPAKYIVCPSCAGSGTTTRHIEHEGGGITASEWSERCNDDPDFSDNYFSGVYDRPCPECEGQRVVTVPDEDHCDPKMLKKHEEYLDAIAQDRRETTLERIYRERGYY